MPKVIDLTEDTSGVIIEDPIVPAERPADQPLDAPIVQNSKPAANTGSALDALAAPLIEKREGTAPELDLDAAAEAAAEKAEAARAAKEKKAADDKKKVDAPAKTAEEIAADKKTAEDKAKADAGKTKEQIAEEKKVAEDKAVADRIASDKAKEPKDKLSEVALPPYVKPPTVDAFNKVKQIAREEKAELEKRLAATEARIPKNGGLTPEVEKELTDLRNFRKAHDLTGDVEFKNTYTKPIEANTETILGKLKASGFTDEQITQIKGIGIDKLDWEPILEKLPAVARRAVEAKLLENDNLIDKRAAALKAAEKAPEEFEKKRKAEADRAASEDRAAADVTAKEILDQVPWFKAKDIPVAATAEERKTLEDHNAFVAEQTARLKEIMSDRSSAMFGTLAASTLLAYQHKRDATIYKGRAEKAEAELERIKKSSTRRPSSAPTDGKIIERKVSIFREDTGSALDRLAAEKTRNAE